jgi:hypothetical protein
MTQALIAYNLFTTTMIIDVSDPAIASTYHHILNAESKDWLILAYSKVRLTPTVLFFTHFCFAFSRRAMPYAS